MSLLAGALAELGVKKGDRVLLYMPLIPETIIGMLATVRLGAIHSVVFGGETNLQLDSSPLELLMNFTRCRFRRSGAVRQDRAC